MRRFRRLRNRRGGVLLDLVLAVLVLGLAAFALNAMGVTFGQLVHGIAHFVNG
ncbi:MAG: hypothetical protein WCA77_06165 [Thermoplasmata archaeon]